MKPLSTLNYTKNNLLKTLPVFISMTVGVFLIYFISLIGKSSLDTVDIATYKLLSSYTIVYSDNETPLPESIVSKVKNSSAVDKVFPMLNSAGSLRYNNVLGNMSFINLNLYEKDIPSVLSKLDMKLVEGRFPIQDGKEILIPEKYARQNKLKVGDYIGSEISMEYTLQGKYLVSGIIDGPTIVSITSDNENKLSYAAAMNYSFIFSLKDKNNNSIIKELNDIEAANTVITDYSSTKKTMEQTLQILSVLTISLDLVTILILCISLGNLNYISFLNRKYEFGVLSAIGYKKTKLYFKLWKENSLVCFAGYAAGLILTTLVCFLANMAIWEADGKFVPLWSSSGVIYAFAVPLFVSLFGLLPPIKELRKTDPIEVFGGNI